MWGGLEFEWVWTGGYLCSGDGWIRKIKVTVGCDYAAVDRLYETGKGGLG